MLDNNAWDQISQIYVQLAILSPQNTCFFAIYNP